MNMQEAPQLKPETSVPADNANSWQRCHSRSHQSESERSERQLTKQLNVDLLERVDTAELVKLMVNLVEDESFVVVSSVVLHYVINCKGSATDINSWDRERPQGGLGAGSLSLWLSHSSKKRSDGLQQEKHPQEKRLHHNHFLLGSFNYC